MTDLKPCPFCGRKPIVDDCEYNQFFVRCECGISQDKLYGQKCDAVRAWNRRKDAQPEGCPYYIKNTHDRGDDSLCGLFHREVKYLAIETRQVGEWIDDNCSLCGQYVHHGDARNYCPNCGAIMVEGEKR